MPSRPACTSAAVADPAGPYAPAVASLGAHMEREGLNWADLDRVLAVRAQLMELDTRFSELSDKGLFRAMERAGALDHHVHGVDNIEHAMQNPPAVGRARLRGQMIRRLAEQRSTYQCDWASVLDLRTNRIMDMSDPFATEERWRDAPENELEPCPF
jgi:hypothetical protein